MVCAGDRPHCTSVGLAEAEERQPMDQISSIEHFLEAGDAAVSNEVAQQARHVICLCHLTKPVRMRRLLAINSAAMHWILPMAHAGSDTGGFCRCTACGRWTPCHGLATGCWHSGSHLRCSCIQLRRTASAMPFNSAAPRCVQQCNSSVLASAEPKW